MSAAVRKRVSRQLQPLFDGWDADGSGEVQAEEAYAGLAALARAIGVPRALVWAKKSVETHFAAYSGDGDVLRFHEFVTMLFTEEASWVS